MRYMLLIYEDDVAFTSQVLDDLAQFGVEGRRIRHVEDNERRRKQRNDLRDSTHAHTTLTHETGYARLRRCSRAIDAFKA